MDHPGEHLRGRRGHRRRADHLDQAKGNPMHRKHTLRTLALTAAAAVAAVLTASPALADPPGGVTPRVIDVVGVGSGATQLLYDQLSHDYGFRFYPALYSWDAMPSGGMITPKAGCTPIVRPA